MIEGRKVSFVIIFIDTYDTVSYNLIQGLFYLITTFQSTMISLVSITQNGTNYNSFQEMFNKSDFNYLVDLMCLETLKSSTENKSLIAKMKVIDQRLSQIDFQQKASEKTAFILRCDMAEYLIYAKSDQLNQNIDDFYYLLPDQINSFFESFLTSFSSPHYNKLQQYSRRVFESGIRQYWKRLKLTKDVHIDSGFMSSNNQGNLFDLKDLRGVFLILAIGLTLAGLIFIIEIFWNDCVSKLPSWMKSRINRRIKKGRRMKVRRIRVAPMPMILEEVWLKN